MKIILIIIVIITIIVLSTLIFTNEKFTSYNNIKNKYFSDNFYIRNIYRLPYRYPLTFNYNNPVSHTGSIHEYDIND